MGGILLIISRFPVVILEVIIEAIVLFSFLPGFVIASNMSDGVVSTLLGLIPLAFLIGIIIYVTYRIKNRDEF